MKARELSEFLNRYPEHEVILSSEVDGTTSYQPLSEPSIQYVEKPSKNLEQAGEIEVFSEEDIDGEIDGTSDPLDFFKPVIVLHPF